MRTLLILAAIATLLLCGCAAKTETPVETSTIVIAGPSTRAICLMQVAAQRMNLSFHFGHNQATDVIAFRLRNSNYEIEAVNFEGKGNFELRLYVSSREYLDMSADEKVLTRLKEAVAAAGPACR